MNICNLKHVYTDLQLNYDDTRLNEITNGRHFEFRRKYKNLKQNYEGAKLNKITNGGHFETEIVG